MNITINPGAATDDAVQIEKIVADIRTSMEELDAAIKKNIPDRIQTDWSDQVRNNWDTYYSADVPEAMDAMSASATNLKKAVDAALKYSNEQ